MAEVERFERRLHTLGLAAAIEEAVVNGLGETCQEFEGGDLTVYGQEPARLLCDGVVGPEIVATDAMREVGHLTGIADGKDHRGIVEVGVAGVGGPMFDAYDAREATTLAKLSSVATPANSAMATWLPKSSFS